MPKIGRKGGEPFMTEIAVSVSDAHGQYVLKMQRFTIGEKGASAETIAKEILKRCARVATSKSTR